MIASVKRTFKLSMIANEFRREEVLPDSPELYDIPRGTANRIIRKVREHFPSARAPKVLAQHVVEEWERLTAQPSRALVKVGLLSAYILTPALIVFLWSAPGVRWQVKGNRLTELEQYQEALVAYENALRWTPDLALAWRMKGVALAKLNRDEEALAALDEAIRLYPSFAEAWCDKGSVLLKLGRFKQALTALEEAIRLRPQFSEAWRCKGGALAGLGRFQESLAAYEEAERLETGAPKSGMPRH